MERWLYLIGFFFLTVSQKHCKAMLSDYRCDPDLDYLTGKITWHTVNLPHSLMYSWRKTATEGKGGGGEREWEKLTGLMKSSPSRSHSIEAAWIPPGMLPVSLSVSLMQKPLASACTSKHVFFHVRKHKPGPPLDNTASGQQHTHGEERRVSVHC